ncbi:MAG: YidC/Oxa1 family membrane protein insertase [Patescibacteria group bacterium]|nr:membrane protein insertase YidC [Patescibacteria group bacterium]MDE1945750.1 YidC/Oxa1 family membrane protein insertase [Patescibacteria group bacterium]
MHAILKALIYKPLYNALIFFIAVIPFHNVGVAVILFTILIKVILFPLSQKSVKTQFAMKQVEPELNALKEKYKDNKQLQAEKVMALYQERGINPFSGILLLLIQFPILMALYYMFLHGGLPAVNHANLYSFTLVPAHVSSTLFGVDVAAKSTVFALLAAVAQFFQMQFMLPKQPKKAAGTPNFSDELSRSMNTQMKYVMPVIIFVIARNFAVVVSLYLITSSLFAIGQEMYVRRKAAPQPGVAAYNK